MSILCLFFFKQKTAYEMRISDWSSDVCSSDLLEIEIIVDDLGSERRAQPPDADWRGVGAGAAHRSRTMKMTAKIASNMMIMKIDWTTADVTCRPRLWTSPPTIRPWRHPAAAMTIPRTGALLMPIQTCLMLTVSRVRWTKK